LKGVFGAKVPLILKGYLELKSILKYRIKSLNRKSIYYLITAGPIKISLSMVWAVFQFVIP